MSVPLSVGSSLPVSLLSVFERKLEAGMYWIVLSFTQWKLSHRLDNLWSMYRLKENLNYCMWMVGPYSPYLRTEQFPCKKRFRVSEDKKTKTMSLSFKLLILCNCYMEERASARRGAHYWEHWYTSIYPMGIPVPSRTSERQDDHSQQQRHMYLHTMGIHVL